MDKKVYKKLAEFYNEIDKAWYQIDPSNLANKYFAIKTVDNGYKLYLKMGTKVLPLGEHSTIDVTDYKNFLTYCKTLAFNILRNNGNE